jgi:outer membrane receptor protein involved in Fe transport
MILSVVLLAAQSAAGQQPTGTVTGMVLDGQSGRPIRGATIAIDGHSGQNMISDLDGRFQFSITPGKYAMKFSAENYLDTTLADVEVKAGEITEASTVMILKTSVTTVDVVEKVAASAEAMLTERKLSAVVSDAISTEEIRRSVASDAAAAVQKVTGVSVVESGYVYVRGLGERYSSTMLNGAVVPTTEPEKRVVPLDLFPAQLIDSVKILKSYTPDLPGEFSGGVVQLRTVEFPTARVFRVTASSGYNTRTSFGRFLTYPGGGRDIFGFDDGTRALPGAIPTNKRLVPGTFNQQQLQEFGRSFANNWEPQLIDSIRPQQSYSMVGGGTFGRFGLVGALTFSNKPIFQDEIQRYVRQEGTRPVVFTNYEDFRSYTETARVGGVLNVALKLNFSNKLNFRNTFTHDTDKEAREFSGYDGSNDSFLKSGRLRWVERALFSTSVEGDHAFARLGNSLLKWQFTYSRSDRDEPDMREVIRGRLPSGNFIYAGLSSSGQRFFNNLDDRIYEPQVEFGTPFYRGGVIGLIKAGFRASLREREFQARRFRFIPQRSTTLPLMAPSNELFAPANIRPDGFQIIEFTRATDRYDATMDIYAGYTMLELGIGSRWRFIGGIRVEDAEILVNSLDPLVPNAQGVAAKLVNRDPVGGINAIYALTPRQNLRFSYSHTVSRPDFRELSPFDFNNVYGGFVTQGNPNLVRAKVNNWDVRWEWFLGGNQLLAASFFTKDFKNPIEVTILPANDLRQTFVNAKGAINRGVELETRTALARLTPALRDFAVQGNFTFVSSDIRIREQDAALLTSTNRPLLGQSRYVFNAITEWARPRWRSLVRFDANYVSRRLSDVGTFGLPDIYQEGNTFLDLSYQYSITENGNWTLKFTGENLADNHYRWRQGDILQRSYRIGRTFSIGMGVTIF